MRNESGARFDGVSECGAGLVFAMGQVDGWAVHGGDGEPAEQVGLSCVCTESAERVDLRFHADRFSEDADLFFSINETTSEGSCALESDDDDVGRRLPEVVFEMV